MGERGKNSWTLDTDGTIRVFGWMAPASNLAPSEHEPGLELTSEASTESVASRRDQKEAPEEQHKS